MRRRLWCIGGLLLGAIGLAASAAEARDLDFDERLAAQRAIEQVYWNHRIWPVANPTPKPPLASVISDASLRRRVESYLAKSGGISADALQAEMNRMAANTRDPQLLRELFDALGNDPYVIAETLARQTLAERWVGDPELLEQSPRIGAARYTLPALAEGGCTEGGWLPTFQDVADPRFFHTAIWTGTELVVWGGLSEVSQGSAMNSGGRYNPATDAWSSTSTGAGAPTARSGHSAVWTGTEMIVWGGFVGATFAQTNDGSRYDPATNSWTAISMGANLPTARSEHTAVWTGSEMIVWGGGYTNSGGRYNPVSDSWSATSTGANLPAARVRHSAVWTGSAMIVWGGVDGGSTYLNSGGRYVPATDTWTTTATSGAVASARHEHTAVWTGSVMIVWGGENATTKLNTGSRYNPTTNSWSATSVGANVPAARIGHSAVWTGTQMVIWGGNALGVDFNSGGRYNPTTNAWTATSTGSDVPSPRYRHTAVWTGTRMVVWGGFSSIGSAIRNSGGRYDPGTDSWTTTATAMGVPTFRTRHSAVWTGSEMIVWGGFGTSYQNSGGRYYPSTDSWLATSTGTDTPSARADHVAVWNGTHMIVWGGQGSGGSQNSGGRYDPVGDSWLPTSTGANVPGARTGSTVIWTGGEMIVWGGFAGGTYLNSGGRYDPSTDSWLPTSTGANVPEARYFHTSVWTGDAMIVWGGAGAFSSFASGARYDPSTDSWSPTTTGAHLPSGRNRHTAVWSGTEMIVWGGAPGMASGGRYCACAQPETYYRDLDGDGYGDSANTTAACAGTNPAGWVAEGGDCDDTLPEINPDALEICDGIDNDCDDIADNLPAPSSVPVLALSQPVTGTARLAWIYDGGDANGFDLLRGDLDLLLGSAGDFAAGVHTCVADDIAAPTVDDTALPASGAGFWYLLRPVNCAVHGSYDSAGASQVGARDAELAASASDCN